MMEVIVQWVQRDKLGEECLRSTDKSYTTLQCILLITFVSAAPSFQWDLHSWALPLAETL